MNRVWKILLVDDEPDVHSVTKLVLGDFAFEGQGLEFLHAYSGAEAMAAFERHPDIAVALVDVVMETEDAGLWVVRRVRDELGNRFVRLILRTGQPGAAPERDVIAQYDINDYKAKTELSSLKLTSTMMTALRSYRDIVELDRQRRALTRMLRAARVLFQSRFLRQFAGVALRELRMLLELKPGAGFYSRWPDIGESVLAYDGTYKELVGRAAITLGEGAMNGDAVFFDTGMLALFIGTHAGGAHLLCVEMLREPTDIDRQLAELFGLEASAALDNLLLLERKHSAQRQAIRALAHRHPKRHSLGGHAPVSTAARLDEARLMAEDEQFFGGDFEGFLKQIATQAESCEWSEAGAVRHMDRVGQLACRLAERAGCEESFCKAIRTAAALHDIGKLFVVPSGSVSWYESDADKRVLAREHTVWGAEFLCGLEWQASNIAKIAAAIALNHHEAWNGTGYPAGKSGQAIPVAARIVAIVDFFDTCTYAMPDSGSVTFSPEETFEMIGAASGFYFDPALVRVFLSHREDFSPTSMAHADGVA